jgi:hypothetical protein
LASKLEEAESMQGDRNSNPCPHITFLYERKEVK